MFPEKKHSSHSVNVCVLLIRYLLILNILLLCTLLCHAVNGNLRNSFLLCQSSYYSFLLTELEGDWTDWRPRGIFHCCSRHCCVINSSFFTGGKFQSVFYYYILKHTYTKFSYLYVIVHYIIFIY